MTKLTRENVIYMRRIYRTGTVSYERLALRFDVGIDTIGSAIRGRTFKYLNDIAPPKPPTRRDKLDPDKVREIRKEFALGRTSQGKMAEKYGVARATIRDVLNGKYWSHVD